MFGVLLEKKIDTTFRSLNVIAVGLIVLAFAQIGASFETIVSANEAQLYKPNGAVYRLAAERCETAPENVVFVTAQDWDASGARQAGFCCPAVTIHARERRIVP